jgi:tetratricopeptide (TPR) repeat protein
LRAGALATRRQSGSSLSAASSINRENKGTSMSIPQPRLASAPAAADPLALANHALRANRPLEALAHADRVLALDGGSVEGWHVFALALRAIGERTLAIAALTRAAALDPSHAAAHALLGCLHDEADQPSLAEIAWRRAVQLDPRDAPSHVNLSSLYGRAAQFELAERHARGALALDPTSRGAHQNLAGILAKQGREDEAQRHRDLAYAGRNLLRVGGANPRLRVLTLASADWGNTPDRHLLPTDRCERLIWFIAYATEAQIESLPPHDVVFNAIGDPEAAARLAAKVEPFLRRSTRAALNRPESVARTARHLARELFAGVTGLDVPACVRLRAGAGAPSGFVGPALARPVDSHGGEGLRRLVDVADAGVEGRDRYLTAFHDFRGADGLYRKYRVFFVDRRPYPYHLAIGSHWLLHYATSGTAECPERRAEELRFLEDPDKALGGGAMDAVREIGARMDLDFAGVDFSLLPDGRVLLFEANATMLVHPEAIGGPLAPKNMYVERITRAFWELLERAAAPVQGRSRPSLARAMPR